MAVRTTSARLDVLESKVDHLADEISEVKTDVKLLLAHRNQWLGAGFLSRLLIAAIPTVIAVAAFIR